MPQPFFLSRGILKTIVTGLCLTPSSPAHGLRIFFGIFLESQLSHLARLAGYMATVLFKAHSSLTTARCWVLGAGAGATSAGRSCRALVRLGAGAGCCELAVHVVSGGNRAPVLALAVRVVETGCLESWRTGAVDFWSQHGSALSFQSCGCGGWSFA